MSIWIFEKNEAAFFCLCCKELFYLWKNSSVFTFEPIAARLNGVCRTLARRVPQVCTAACSSPTASAPRMSWWPWTTVKNPCRRSTSPPSWIPSADTSGSSGSKARLQDGLEGIQNLQGALPTCFSERVRRNGQRTGLPWPPRPGICPSSSSSFCPM